MSKWFKFSYRPYIAEDLKTREKIEIFRPTIPIIIVYKSRPSWDFQALVDSGSDRNLFPAKIGESIGIDIGTGGPRPIMGIGDKEVTGFTHKVKILIGGIDFDSEIDFSYEQSSPLLGRSGFFDHFKDIAFNEKAKEITFKP